VLYRCMLNSIIRFSVFLCVCVRVFLCLFCSVCQFSFFCVLWAKLPEIKLMMIIKAVRACACTCVHHVREGQPDTLLFHSILLSSSGGECRASSLQCIRSLAADARVYLEPIPVSSPPTSPQPQSRRLPAQSHFTRVRVIFSGHDRPRRHIDDRLRWVTRQRPPRREMPTRTVSRH